MEIQSIHGEWSIIKRIYRSELFEINICRYDEDPRYKMYTVIKVIDQKLIHESITLFSSLRNNDKFTDFIKCFSKNSCLYIVFLYHHSEESLNFEEIYDFPLLQRVDIVKQILSLIVIFDIPHPILYDVLANINLDSSGKVYFNYFLKNINRYKNISNKSITRKIAMLFINIFNKELELDSVSGLKELIIACKSGKYNNIMEIYRDYILLYSNFEESLNITKQKKLNWFRQLINKIIKVFNKIKGVIIMIILCIGIIYLIVILTAKPKLEDPTKIKSIGTLQIAE